MDPRQMFLDERLRGSCVLCGAESTTRDHVPAKVFLDDPLPQQLPVVEMCAPCNQSASSDEEYVACLIDVVVHGDATSAGLRTRITRSLAHSPHLLARLSQAQRLDGDRCTGFTAEVPRLHRVLDKIGRGLWAYEVGEPAEQFADLRWAALHQPTSPVPDEFMLVSGPQLFPELGSRGFVSAVDTCSPKTRTLQPGRFRYSIDLAPERPTVRMVFSEHLAVECLF